MYEVCSESNAPDKITYERYTLERWRKNIYFEDGYFLSKSFWVHTAQMYRLIGRASQSALEAATPPVRAVTEARIFTAARARAAKSRRE